MKKLQAFISLTCLIIFVSLNAFAADNSKMILEPEATFNSYSPTSLLDLAYQSFEALPELQHIDIIDVSVSDDIFTIILSESSIEAMSDLYVADFLVSRLPVIAPDASIYKVFIETYDGIKPLDYFIKEPKSSEISSSRITKQAFKGSQGESHFPKTGALTGKTIVISPGHGWFWNTDSSSWVTQRPYINGMIEDLTNLRMASHVMKSLEHAGAIVRSCRERDMNTHEIIVDNDTGTGYSDGSGWQTGSSSGYGGTYRFSYTVTDDSGVMASWLPTFPAEGNYAVYVNFKAGENRATNSRFIVKHAGGENVVLVDQETNDRRWVYIGSYYFNSGNSDEGVYLSPKSDESGVVIADAVKFGGGLGSLERNNASSGKPRHEEASRYWVEFAGAPYATYNGHLSDRTGDITVRPKYANWINGDAYISLHSNAAGSPNVGYGTDTFMYNGGATTGSKELRNAVQSRVVEAIRSEWDSTWKDRGTKEADFGELRELASMPGCLIEVGFHDTEYDAAFLKRPKFRDTVARAITKATLDYFSPSSVLYPLPVTHIMATPNSSGGIRLSWKAQNDPTFTSDGIPASYRIYIAKNGRGTDEGGIVTTEKHYDFNNLEQGELYAFRVAAVNAGGESFPSEPAVVRIGDTAPQILIVNAFDRLDRSIQEEENTNDYNVLHAKAIKESGKYYFASASNEAVEAGLVNLDDFEMIDWVSGEEARLDGETADYHSFSSTERTKLTAFSNNGGNLFVSGSEIGWDLQNESTDYLAFYNNILKANYVADDANNASSPNEYSIKGKQNTLFAGISTNFDNGEHGTYNVDYPEIISENGGSVLCLTYGDVLKGLGVCYEGSFNMIYFGVPFEAIYPANSRLEIMSLVLSKLATEATIPTEDGDEEIADIIEELPEIEPELELDSTTEFDPELEPEIEAEIDILEQDLELIEQDENVVVDGDFDAEIVEKDTTDTLESDDDLPISDGDVTEEDTENDLTFTIKIGPNGGSFTTNMGVEMTIPKGALTTETEISIRQLKDFDASPIIPVSPIWEFLPEDLSFLKPVVVAIPYSDPKEEVDLDFYWSVEQNSDEFEIIGNAILNDVLATALIDHFSISLVGYVIDMTDGDDDDDTLDNQDTTETTDVSDTSETMDKDTQTETDKTIPEDGDRAETQTDTDLDKETIEENIQEADNAEQMETHEEIDCVEGFHLEDGKCVKDDDDGGGGCNTSQNSASALVLILLLALLGRRRLSRIKY